MSDTSQRKTRKIESGVDHPLHSESSELLEEFTIMNAPLSEINRREAKSAGREKKVRVVSSANQKSSKKPTQMERSASAFFNILTEEEVQEFKEIFSLVDRDGSGRISTSELAELMQTLGQKKTQEEIEQMVQEIDQNNDGEIDFREFLAVMSSKRCNYYKPTDLKHAFRVFARKDQPNIVRIVDLVDALTRYGTIKLNKEEAHTLCSRLDRDNSGEFNYVEYVNYMADE